MKYLLAIVVVFSTLPMFGQTINGVKINEISTAYVEVLAVSKALSNKITIKIDYGQSDDIWSSKDDKILDPDGKPVEFNSVIEALNFMSNHGYDFVNAYVITSNGQSAYHYLLKRRQ